MRVHHFGALGARKVFFGHFAKSKRGKNKHLWPEMLLRLTAHYILRQQS